MKKLESYKGVKGGINDMEVVDKISSSFALGKTKDLLYDVTKVKAGECNKRDIPIWRSLCRDIHNLG